MEDQARANTESVRKQDNIETGNGGHLGGETPPDERAAKRVKMDVNSDESEATADQKPRERMKGVASIRQEYLIQASEKSEGPARAHVDDDAAEGRSDADATNSGPGGKRDREKKRGQNTQRQFGRTGDSMPLCQSRVHSPEFSPKECKFGDSCRNLHDLRKYLAEGRRGDLATLGGSCPLYEKYGKCPSGWRCRFLSSHMKEIEHEDGRKELVLLPVGDSSKIQGDSNADEHVTGVVNVISYQDKINLSRKRVKFEKAEAYIKWMNEEHKREKQRLKNQQDENGNDDSQDHRAKYVEPPLKPSEKRRIYFGRETPVLAPLTTQGNLPFRRLCVDFGAQATYSEMALGLPLLQGAISDWPLLKAHESEITPPRIDASKVVVQDYDNSRDLKFSAQITAAFPDLAIRTTEALTTFLPHLRLIDLNCGCPIDMIFKSGAGSGLMDAPSKLERIIRGMNAVSGEVPITCKLRTGVKDGKPTALRLIERLAFGQSETRAVTGPAGCAAITLHGRTRQQRYTRSADWGYIAECAAMLESFRQKEDDLSDTVMEPEQNLLPNGGKMYFLGNGDCFSHVDYFEHIDNAKVDSVMIGRGAIIKPWIFEEVEKGQYLDKSASERLGYLERFARYGLEAWGSDEVGIGFTRRFLLEFMSFFHRYVPIGLLEYLPPSINDRPPKYRGRNDLETLLASDNYKDWIKISEMFLGPAHPEFKFVPKHKSNSYEIEAEG